MDSEGNTAGSSAQHESDVIRSRQSSTVPEIEATGTVNTLSYSQIIPDTLSVEQREHIEEVHT